MYYCAQWSIQLGSLLLTISWITQQTHASDNSVEHLLRSGLIFLGIYSLVVAAPYFLVLKTPKKGMLCFFFAESEGLVSVTPPSHTTVHLTSASILLPHS